MNGAYTSNNVRSVQGTKATGYAAFEEEPFAFVGSVGISVA